MATRAPTCTLAVVALLATSPHGVSAFDFGVTPRGLEHRSEGSWTSRLELASGLSPQSDNASSAPTAVRQPRLLASLFLGTLLGLLVAAVGAVQPARADGQSWSYADTTEWNAAFPMCKGEEQSPINLTSGDVLGSPKDTLKDRLAYVPLKGREVFNNNTKNVQVNGGFGSLKLPDGVYDVKQFHFHFPAEHEVNGKVGAGELHIVHQKRGSEGTNDLAVVGIILEEVPDSSLQRPELKFMRQLGFGEELPGEKMKVLVDAPLDLNAFVDEYMGSYYHYTGSLTTPPCSEKVHWYVLQKPAPVTKAMIGSFKARFPDNNRRVQPLNTRKLVQSDVAVEGEFVLP